RRDALRDLRAQLVALGGEQLLALLEEPQGFDHDLVDRVEAAGLELGADQLLHFVGQRGQLHARQYTGAHRAALQTRGQTGEVGVPGVPTDTTTPAPYGPARDPRAIPEAVQAPWIGFQPWRPGV